MNQTKHHPLRDPKEFPKLDCSQAGRCGDAGATLVLQARFQLRATKVVSQNAHVRIFSTIGNALCSEYGFNRGLASQVSQLLQLATPKSVQGHFVHF